MCSWRARARPSASVSPIALDDKGAAYFATKMPAPNAARGVRIMFAGSDGEEKTLYYFSTDLSNSGVKASGFLKFCATLAPGNSLIKSASYLLHSGNFTTVRDFLLANSATIIQDDSGIPLAYYNHEEMALLPVRPLCRARSTNSPDATSESYAELFRRAQPIDFGIGYRWRTHESNLLLSVRLPDDGSRATDAAASTDAAAASRRAREAAAAGVIRRGGFLDFCRSRERLSSGARTPGLHQRTLWLGTMKAACLARLRTACRNIATPRQ